MRTAAGVTVDVLGGTQDIDGWWAWLRRAIGRVPVNTGAADSEKRAWLHKLVRVAQWHFWHLDADRFKELGATRREARAALGEGERNGVFFL